MQEWIRQFRKGLLELCVLNLLCGDESYGYEIVHKLKDIEVLSLTESTLYPILTRLGKERHLQVRSVPSSNGPPRRYFSLTISGKVYLENLNIYWGNLKDAIDGLINKQAGKE
ncbi:MAG: helix-turn-helix transcriptional regulator [Spirochaetales bacterium]|nr:helix-turn-helix transcriptional regulator [Spirochaetales bacterium]